jgi:dCTP deaminase
VILSSVKIYELVHSQDIPPDERLWITPVLNWEQQAKSTDCAIDVRLGQKFTVPQRTKVAYLDHLDDQHAAQIAKHKEECYVLLGDYYVLHPGQFVLGETLEWIRLPKKYGAYVIGRSAWGRDGLIIATATGIHSNYSGIVTLELTNLGEIPIRLYPGLCIAQLFIHTVEQGTVTGPDGASGSFVGSVGPRSANAAGSDKRIIKRLAKKRGFVDQT